MCFKLEHEFEILLYYQWVELNPIATSILTDYACTFIIVAE
jgi:hypothetical protein